MYSHAKSWIREHWVFCIVVGLSSLMYLALSLLRHWHFESNGFDLGIFDQAIWHYSRFEAPASTVREIGNLLGDHFHPILVLSAPLYWLFPHAQTLLVAQILLWAGSLFPIYLFAQAKGHSKLVSLLLVLSYVFFWGTTLTLYYDFHEIAFALFLIPWIIYLIEIKQWKWFWWGVALLLLTKEDMGIVVAFLGVYLLVKHCWKQAAVAFLLGSAWFVVAIRILIPHFGTHFGYWTYSNLGSTPQAAIKAIIFHPINAFKLLITPQVKLHTLLQIFWPFGFLSLFSPILIIGLPLLLERFWSDQGLYWVADFHYNGTIAAILIMALADTLTKIKRLPISEKTVSRTILGITVLILIFNLSFLPKYQLRSLADPTYWHLSAGQKAGYQVLAKIPTDASVSTLNAILPHLTDRQYAFMLAGNGKFYYTEYIIVSSEVNIFPFESMESLEQYIQSKITGRGYRLIINGGGWQVWQNPSLANTIPVAS